jgi:hypothetical protein
MWTVEISNILPMKPHDPTSCGFYIVEVKSALIGQSLSQKPQCIFPHNQSCFFF